MQELLLRLDSCMQVREMSAKTRDAYVWHARAFGQYCGRSPALLGYRDAEQYLLHLLAARRSSSTRNQCASALRFLYRVVLDRPEDAEKIPLARRHQRLPDVLSGTEVMAVLGAFNSVVHRTIAMVCYGAGLRVSEACTLCIGDIDSERELLHIRDAKGSKDRFVTLSTTLLHQLRECWKIRRPKGPYLFEGKVPGSFVDVSSFQKALTLAARRAGLRKRVSPHVLRHSYATHMVEIGADLRSLQLQLGHSCVSSTVRYVHLTYARRKDLKNPLDVLMNDQGRQLG